MRPLPRNVRANRLCLWRAGGFFKARVVMHEQSEVIKPINELDERAGSRESVRSDDNNLEIENVLDAKNDIGRISLEFIDADAKDYSEYPDTYYTFSARERFLLIYTETFRRKFVSNHPERKPLVLAIPNECAIQKFVSTTVRPTSSLFRELIDCWHGPAQFVADFITYEPLENPLQLVNKYKTIAIFYSGKILLNSFLFVNLYIYNMWFVWVIFSLHFFVIFSIDFFLCVCVFFCLIKFTIILFFLSIGIMY